MQLYFDKLYTHSKNINSGLLYFKKLKGKIENKKY